MYPTSDRFREVITRSHRALTRVQLLSSVQFGDTPTGGLELPVLSGDVVLSSTSDVKGSLEIEVPGDYWESVQPYGVELFAERGVDFGDNTHEYIPLGYYMVTDASQDEAPWGPVRVRAEDRIRRMIEARIPYPYAYPAGLSHALLFDRMVNGYVDPTGFNGGPNTVAYGLFITANVPIHFDGYDGANQILPAGVVEDSVYEHLAKIADSRGCVLRFDRLGELRIIPRDRAPGAASVYTVRPGQTGNLISTSRSTTRDGVYNMVIARGSDPEQPTGYRLAYNDDASSPLRWNGPFGVTPRYYASPLLRTAEGADRAAETLLARYKGLPLGVSVVAVPDPSIEPLDPITIGVGSQDQEHLSDEVRIPLTVRDPVRITARTLNEIPAGEDDGDGSIGNPGPGTDPGGPGPGTPGGVAIFEARFKDGRAFPIIKEVDGMQVVPVANSSELTSKLAAAAPNQKLVLSDGTYSGAFTCSKAGTPTQPIMITPLNPGGALLASTASFRLTGKWLLLHGLYKDFDTSGKTFSIEGAAEFCRITRTRVGPASLGAADAGAEKSLHYYIGGTAQDCVIDYAETRNKSKPGNGILVDGNFDGGTTGGCKHILISHMDVHDYGSEAVNDFEAIRFGVSTMQETVTNSTIMRCVFTNIQSEPEVISGKMDTIESWGHTVRNCVGSLSSRHGSRQRHMHCYVFGGAIGSAGTKSGGVRLYDDDIEVSDCYFEEINGSGFQDTICVDGGDTTEGGTNNGHKQVRRAKILRNVIVNSATPITVGRNYSIAPDSLTIMNNLVVNSGTPPAGGGGGTGTPAGGFTAQLFVATNGSDSNSGTSASSPKRTIAAAMAAAAPGQTISVAPGTYTGNVVTPKGGNSSGGYITVRSAQKHAAIISGNDAGNEAAVEIGHQYVRFQDMRITGTDNSALRIGVLIKASNVEIIGNKIHNVCRFLTEGTGFQGGGGVDFDIASCSNILITQNLFHDIGAEGSTQQLVHGCYLSTHVTNGVVSNNVFYRIEDFAVHPYDETEASGWKVINNTVFDTGRGILQAPDGETRNNLVHNVNGRHFDIRGSGNTGSNNIMSGTGTGHTGGAIGATTGTAQFVDASADNYRLTSGSAGVNAGTATSAPAVDHDGAPRPVGTTDVGAFEFGSTPPASGGGGTGGGSETGAVQIIKAPTGTNNISANLWFATPAAAGLTLDNGVYRRPGYGPQLVKLERAEVGPGADPNEDDSTGLSIGGAPGGGTGGVPERTQAAQLIRDRLSSGSTIFEDWTWSGSPAIVGTHNDALLGLYEADNPGESSLDTDIAVPWLDDYIATNGGTGGGGGGTGSGSTPGALLKIGTAAGFTKVNIGLGFLPGDDLDRDGDGHSDFHLAEIGNGLIVPGHFEMSDNGQAVKLTAYAGGGTTSPNTEFSRSEFRELGLTGNGSSSHPKAAWDPKNGRNGVFVTQRVVRCPGSKPEICVVQTHDSSDDTSQLRFEGGNLQLKVNGSDVFLEEDVFDLGVFYDMGIIVENNQIRFYFGSTTTPIYTHSFTSSAAQYTKFGNYIQFNEAHADEDDFAVVEVSRCYLVHPGFESAVTF